MDAARSMARLCTWLLFIILVGGCQGNTGSEDLQATSETTSVPTPAVAYQTGVHLQGVYELPDWLLGLEPFNTEMEYLLYLPDGYGQDPEKEWPLIVFLHGSGDDDYDSGWVMSVGLPEVLFSGDQPDNFEFIVLSPQSFNYTTWWDRATPAVVNELVDEIVSTYQVDGSRVYLTGLSMGGYGSWYVAATNPKRYAAMASISGSGFRTSTIPPAETLCQIEEVPIWGIHGSLDQISGPNANRAYLEAYEEICDGEIFITFYPNEGHFGAYAKAYRDPALYDWFLERTKPQSEADLSEES
jgi:predicted peptidase